MDDREAIQLLERELAAFRDESYVDLVRRIQSGSLNYEQLGTGGAKYQLEIQFLWDGPTGGKVRVLGSIDDGGWRAFVPLTRSFIKSADGSID